MPAELPFSLLRIVAMTHRAEQGKAGTIRRGSRPLHHFNRPFG
jgi:hypothetical protein